MERKGNLGAIISIRGVRAIGANPFLSFQNETVTKVPTKPMSKERKRGGRTLIHDSPPNYTRVRSNA